MRKKFFTAAAITGWLLTGATNSGGQSDFYQGKTMRIIVGFSAGGGYDQYSRLIARHLSKYIPGNPAVIADNMPGAGSIIAANHVYNAAPKAVLAAIAVSFAVHLDGEERLERAAGAVLAEWWALYRAGVVPQKPPLAAPDPDGAD